MNRSKPLASAPASGLLIELARRIHPVTGRIAAATDRVLRALVAALLCVMILDVCLQVVLRQIDRVFGVSTSTGRTEELPSLLLIWIALLGGSIAVGERSHLAVDALSQMFPPRLARINDQLVHALMLLFSTVVLLWGGWNLSVLAWTSRQMTPAWELPMAAVYLALPLAGCLNIVYLVHLVVERLASYPARGSRGQSGA